MDGFFSAHIGNGQNFEILSPVHILMLLSLAIINVVTIIFRKSLRAKEKLIRYMLAGAFILLEFTNQIWNVAIGNWSLRTSLPLHLCGLTSICCIFMLLYDESHIFEILYFWGLVGSPLALIFPDIKTSYNHFSFWMYVSTHSLNIISIIFMISVKGRRPYTESIKKCFIFTNIYMACIALFNYIVGSNYYFFYLCRKPTQGIANPLMYIKSWPLIILSLELVTIAALIVYYTPFAVHDIRKNKRQCIN